MPRTAIFPGVLTLTAMLCLPLIQTAAVKADNPGASLIWSQQADLTAAMPLSSQHRGGRDIAYDAQTLVVGASFVDDPADDEGKVFVFTRDDAGTPADPTDDGWLPDGVLMASDADVGDNFGADVEVEGNVIVVGAWHDDEAAGNGGAAYVFEYIGGAWIETAKLLSSNPTPQARFGRHTIVVSALREEVDGVSEAGAVYVCEFDGSDWTETARLVASDGQAYDHFGRDVAIYGHTLAVGAPKCSDVGVDAGAVYIFRRSGGVWSETAKLTSPLPQASALFGDIVALEGDLLAVGIPNDDSAAFIGGAVAVLRYDGAGWVNQDWLTADDLWVVDQGSDFAFRYAGGANRTSGSQNANEVIPLANGNSSPQGLLTR